MKEQANWKEKIRIKTYLQFENTLVLKIQSEQRVLISTTFNLIEVENRKQNF
jgi:hypothetical protein